MPCVPGGASRKIKCLALSVSGELEPFFWPQRGLTETAQGQAGRPQALGI
jgi:hypothetical protein